MLPPPSAKQSEDTGSAGMNHRGTVRFIGKTTFGGGSGVWVGVEYDEPVGRGDGSYVLSLPHYHLKYLFTNFLIPSKKSRRKEII